MFTATCVRFSLPYIQFCEPSFLFSMDMKQLSCAFIHRPTGRESTVESVPIFRSMPSSSVTFLVAKSTSTVSPCAGVSSL